MKTENDNYFTYYTVPTMEEHSKKHKIKLQNKPQACKFVENFVGRIIDSFDWKLNKKNKNYKIIYL